MTITELKKILKSYPDDSDVYFISAKGVEEDGSFSEVKYGISGKDSYYTRGQLILGAE